MNLLVSLKLYSIALLLLFADVGLYAQYDEFRPNTLLTGELDNAVVKQISVTVTQNYLNRTETQHSALLTSTNKFAFALQIDAPQLVTLSYNRINLQLYLEPNDSLHIKAAANNLARTIQFSNRSSANNECWMEFVRLFKRGETAFDRMSYKKGIVYYHIDGETGSVMQTLKADDFSKSMLAEFQRKNDFVKLYTNRGLTPTFEAYLRAEISYDWAYKMLTYGYVFEQIHQISPDFFGFLRNIPIQDNRVLSNPRYREFLIGYINYRYDKSERSEEPYLGQFDMAAEVFEEQSLYFIQADLLIRSFKKDQFPLTRYKKFVEETPHEAFGTAVVDAYQQANKYKEGSPAPNFTYRDFAGNRGKLSDLRGKMVYMDFWASWCKPCIAKLDMIKRIKARLPSDEVVFIHVSLERDEAKWREQIRLHQLDGLHIYLPDGFDSPLVAAYNVKALPEYFLINQSGNFIKKPARFNQEELLNIFELEVRN